MRKDFLTDPYQVIEARLNGASGVLLIVTMLDADALDSMLACALELGLFVLLEAFDNDDLERIGALGLEAQGAHMLAGVNCRNLKTLEVDFGRFAELAAVLPQNLPTVAESGIAAVADIETVAGLGYRLALVGSALMLAEDAAATMSEMLAAGRAKTEAAN